MKRVLMLGLLLSLICTLPACVHEQREGPHYVDSHDIVARIDNQQHRIDEGTRSGQLTRHEANMLQDNLNYIRNDFSRNSVYDRLTPHEHERLNRLLDQNSEMIYREKHNEIRRLY
jgi:hypothetical protein